MSSHFTQKATLSLDDGLQPALEGHVGLVHHGLVHGGKDLLNGGDQGGLGSVGTGHIGLYVSPSSPMQNVQRIKIRTAGRPAVLRDQVVAVFLEPLDGPVGDMAGDRVKGIKRFSVLFTVQTPLQIVFLNNFENCRSVV